MTKARLRLFKVDRKRREEIFSADIGDFPSLGEGFLLEISPNNISEDELPEANDLISTRPKRDDRIKHIMSRREEEGKPKPKLDNPTILRSSLLIVLERTDIRILRNICIHCITDDELSEKIRAFSQTDEIAAALVKHFTNFPYSDPQRLRELVDYINNNGRHDENYEKIHQFIVKEYRNLEQEKYRNLEQEKKDSIWLTPKKLEVKSQIAS